LKQELKSVTMETQLTETDARQIAQLWNQTGCAREEVPLLSMCENSDRQDFIKIVQPTLRIV